LYTRRDGGAQAIAMPFTVTGTNYTFSSADLAMSLAHGTSPLEISLAADAGCLPSDVIETMVVNLAVGARALTMATSTLNPTLVAGSNYWITAVASGDLSSVWKFAGSPGMPIFGSHSWLPIGLSSLIVRAFKE